MARADRVNAPAAPPVRKRTRRVFGVVICTYLSIAAPRRRSPSKGDHLVMVLGVSTRPTG